MFRSLFKLVFLTVLIAAVVGYVNFGRDLPGYVRSAAHVLSRTVRQNISVDFQLNRARDLLEETTPEIENNVRRIADQEAAVAGVRNDIQQSSVALADEKGRIEKLRDDLGTNLASFTYGQFTYTRAELTDELSRRFSDYKEAESSLAQKRTRLDSRQHALGAAEEAIDRARSRQAQLKLEIDSLESRYQVVQASDPSGDMALDDSTLRQASQAVADVRHDLDVAERMLAEEARFTQPTAVSTVSEKDLVGQIDAHLATAAGVPDAVAAK